MRRGSHATKANASAKLKAWRTSPRFKALAREAGLRGLAIAHTKARCGAKTRSGEPCRGFAMANGRCRIHGGATTSGDRWHRPRLPKKGEVRGVEKFEAKLAAQEKREAQRRRKLAAMSPEERERHEKWQASHKPGPPGERAHRRQQRGTRKMIDDLLAAADARRVEEEQRELALRAEVSRTRTQRQAPPPAKAPVENPLQEHVDVFA